MNITNPWLSPYQRSYHQIKQQLITGLTSITDRNGRQLITDVSEGNILVILISMFAAIAEVLHYYIDTKAREFFLGTARRYSSVQALGRLVGYYPHGATAATTDLVITRILSLNTSYTVPADTTITTSDGTVWSVAEDVHILANVGLVRIPLIQHRPLNLDGMLGTIVQNVNSISLPPDVIPSGEYYEHGTLKLSIDSEQWTLVDTFAYSNSTDKHFRVELSESGTILVVFGDGIFGSIPDGIISSASCYITKGSNGNVEAGSITSIPSPLSTNMWKGSNEFTASGGTDYETIESMRERIPLQARTQGVAITKRDYEDLALSVPGVAKAKVDYKCGRKVAMYIFPKDSTTNSNLQAANTLKQKVWDKLNPYLPLTTILKVFSMGTSNMFLDIDVTGKPNYKKEDILSHIRTALYNNYNTQVSEIGGSIRISDLYALIDNLASVDYLRINKFYVIPWIIPLNGGLGFIPASYNPTAVKQSVVYIVTVTEPTNATLVSSDGKYSKNISLISNQDVNDTYHSIQFSVRMFSNQASMNNLNVVVGRKYQFTVSMINSDYTDTGYTLPVFTNNSNLITNIVETI